MVLILSNQNDQSTSDVMDWLLYYGKKVIRINENEKINGVNLLTDNSGFSFKINIGDKEFNLLEIESFWFRRGGINSAFHVYSGLDGEILEEIDKHLMEECQTIEKFLIALLQNRRSVGNYYQGNANKLISLYMAKLVGLKVPETIITTRKSSLMDFHQKKHACVTKFIQDVLSFSIDHSRYFTTTSEVAKDDIDAMGMTFFPSQLQVNIPKRYEIRSFYLDGSFYSMAIFSQEDEKTKLDFRNYNTINPNRCVPYKLPFEIETKLDEFMKKMNLDTGSIDMIVTPELEYVFLEVNPVGQYDMVSVPCNYYLHKKIADYLRHGEK